MWRIFHTLVMPAIRPARASLRPSLRPSYTQSQRSHPQSLSQSQGHIQRASLTPIQRPTAGPGHSYARPLQSLDTSSVVNSQIVAGACLLLPVRGMGILNAVNAGLSMRKPLVASGSFGRPANSTPAASSAPQPTLIHTPLPLNRVPLNPTRPPSPHTPSLQTPFIQSQPPTPLPGSFPVRGDLADSHTRYWNAQYNIVPVTPGPTAPQGFGSPATAPSPVDRVIEAKRPAASPVPPTLSKRKHVDEKEVCFDLFGTTSNDWKNTDCSGCRGRNHLA